MIFTKKLRERVTKQSKNITLVFEHQKTNWLGAHRFFKDEDGIELIASKFKIMRTLGHIKN